MTDEKPADWRPLVALELVDIDGNTVLVPVTGRAEFGTADSLQAEITVGSGRSIAEVAKSMGARTCPRLVTPPQGEWGRAGRRGSNRREHAVEELVVQVCGSSVR